MKKNRNKGFSMIELIVVIGIMGIFTAIASIGFGYIQSGNVKSAARNIDATLTKLKLDTMKLNNQPTMYLYRKGEDYYMYCTADASFTVPTGSSSAVGKHIGNSNVVIKYDDGSGTLKEINTGGTVKIQFSKGSGIFLSGYTHISVESKSGGVKYDIEMIPETGKHFVNVK